MNSSYLGKKIFWITTSIAGGCAVVAIGLAVLHVRPELYWGLDGFDAAWMAAEFVVPFVAGMVVSMLYGLGGKILAHFPPLIVFSIGYLQTMGASDLPEGASLMPLALWGFFVILAMEFCAFGGVIGEVAIKRIYGRGRQAMGGEQQER